MRRLAKLALLLNWAFVLTIASTLLLGSQQPRPSAVFHLSACAFPCWNGIVPGKSTIAEGKTRLRQVYGAAAQYTVAEGDTWVDIRNMTTHILELRIVFLVRNLNPREQDTIEALELQSNIAIGNLLTIFPQPRAIVLWGKGGGTFPALLFTNGGVLTIDMPILDPTKCIVVSGSESLQTLTIFPSLPQDDHWGGYAAQQWKGFAHCYRWNFVADT
jgi:hypothetical protein